MKIYHNPRCGKSRQALKILIENGINPQIIEYLKIIPTADELKDVISLLGIRPYDLLRRGEKDFKDNFKGKELNDSQWINAMVEYPKLIERPIFINGSKAVVGRPPEKVLDII